jgi:hypothetical protein
MHIPIPPQILVRIYFNLQLRNHSIFKNFCTASPNVMEPKAHAHLLLIKSFPKTLRIQ